MQNARKMVCQKCGDSFEASPKGRPPKLCPDCNPRKKTAAQKRRELRRHKAVTAGKKMEELHEELQSAALLAAGMSIYDDPKEAAKWAGLALDSRQLRKLQERANELHPDIQEGDVEALKRRGLALQHLIQTRLMAHVISNDVSPRDLPHVQRAAAQAIEITSASSKGGRFSEIRLFVVGADGKPFEPAAVPQFEVIEGGAEKAS